ncbi:MAG: BMP family ABC transporter substrate-binding protein, partial [Spirochaetota bacterium]
MKKVLLLALSILLLSCITLYAEGTREDEEVGMKVGLVTDVGKVDDKTFNQFAYEGMMRAAEEFDLKADYIETLQPTDYEKNIQTFAEEGYDIIV